MNTENSNNKTNVIPFLAMLITVIFWGLSFISIKIAVNEIPPLTLALIRFAIASIILFFMKIKMDKNSKLKKENLSRMALCGFLGVTAYFFLENTGVKYTTASNASLIVSMASIFSIILDRIIYKTKLSKQKTLGIIIAISGTYFVVTANGQLDFSSNTFKGNIFMVGAITCWACFTLVIKSLYKVYSSISLAFYQNAFGTMFLFPLSLFEYKQWHSFSLTALIHVIFLAVCCSALGYSLYNYSLKKLNVVSTTLYLNLVPIIAVVFSYIILDERILPIQLFGGILTIGGIIVVNISKGRYNIPADNKKYNCH